ncbi:thiopeptide maturation pyridine synthase [Nonomuraea sp. B10E15]|uniref:thiopeptide maturation pyridine synthase n=1 Tax=Nonomuraea sp. B10E15 TaxID=3153560 RepID=UPI00325EAA55
MRWQSFHVFYGGDQDRLVAEGVRPLFAALAGELGPGHRAYFVRHWRRGPHLRLNLLTRPGGTDLARQAVDEHMKAFLAAAPSTAPRRPEAEMALHRRLAELEGEPGPLAPWAPDNSVEEAPYAGPRTYGGASVAAGLLAEHLAATTPLAFDIAGHVMAGGRRLAVAFDLMITTAGLLGGGLSAGLVSFRSHAEAFLATWPEGDGRRDLWDGHFAAHEADLVERTRRLATPGAAPFTRAWSRALTAYARRARAELRAGRLRVDGDDSGWEGPEPGSPFHRALAAERGWPELRDSATFAMNRLLLNATYSELTRLGVTPAERFLLCHLAAGAGERVCGVTALDALRQSTGGERREDA